MDDGHLNACFEKLTSENGEGHAPFRWQMRLLHRLIDIDLPRVVDVPTGLGKTSVMALWLIALSEGISLPRRLVYVVDRRAVVDQATRFAERLRSNMPGELAKRLELDASTGLPISTLRGGFADNRDWLEDPSKPAIVVGTIDMVGSRLLFEGYGVSRGMRPYHAGLLGVDALVLLDEAHLCPPFEALLRQVESHRDGKAAERWQNAMNAPRDKGRPYAKTRGGGNPRLLEGYRHEFGSLLKADGLDLPNDTRDLILHLIAAHHGYARPMIRPAGCEDGPPSVLESKAGDAALRFARLQKRYGPWGLAWREAILRAADQSASREWSKNQRGPRDG